MKPAATFWVGLFGLAACALALAKLCGVPGITWAAVVCVWLASVPLILAAVAFGAAWRLCNSENENNERDYNEIQGT